MEREEPWLRAVRSIAWLGVAYDVARFHDNSFRICIIDTPVAFDPPSVSKTVRPEMNTHRVAINDVYPVDGNRLEVLLSKMGRHQR